MFTTIEQVKELTQYDVGQELVIMAQSLVEAYVGHVEADIEDANDLALLGKATAYQAAYMNDNYQQVFEQASVKASSQNGSSMVFDDGNLTSPWIAPLAVLACQKLSWKRMRSVKTGALFGHKPLVGSWATE